MALTEPEWDFQTEPMTFEPGTWANPELGEFVGELSTVGWTDPNVAPAYQSLPGWVSTAGMTYAEGLDEQNAINEALKSYAEDLQAQMKDEAAATSDPMAVAAQTVAAAQTAAAQEAAMAAAKSEATKAAALQEEEHQFWSWYGEPEDYGDIGGDPEGGYGEEDPGVW